MVCNTVVDDTGITLVSAQYAAQWRANAQSSPAFEGTRAGGRFLARTTIGMTTTRRMIAGDCHCGHLSSSISNVSPNDRRRGCPDGQVPKVGVVEEVVAGEQLNEMHVHLAHLELNLGGGKDPTSHQTLK
jgi:hypothetical protein